MSSSSLLSTPTDRSDVRAPTVAPAASAPPRPHPGHVPLDPLGPGARAAATAAVVAAHLLLAAAVARFVDAPGTPAPVAAIEATIVEAPEAVAPAPPTPQAPPPRVEPTPPRPPAPRPPERVRRAPPAAKAPPPVVATSAQAPAADPVPPAPVAPPKAAEPVDAPSPPAPPAPAPPSVRPEAPAAAPTPAPAPGPAPGPAPPAPAAPRTVAVGAVRYLTPPVLEYPLAARRAREEGRVHVRVLVDVEGRPAQTQVVHTSGYPRLDAAALATVLATRFRPYTENGVPMPFWVVMPLVFELEN